MDSTINYWASYVTPLRRALPLPSLALATVISKDGSSVYASSDTLFKGAVFGRDSLEVADDLLLIKPALVHNILLTMGKLQGLVQNDQNEEQPGKIIHEYRSVIVDGRPIRGVSLRIFQELSRKWGGTEQELAYYGSVDATPHFLRTLGAYCRRYGNAILDEAVTQRNGQAVPMRQVAMAATGWLIDQLTLSGTGMLEYQKVNLRGISNQVWKDSEEFYVHESGEMANHAKPIASIEVQGLAYDALLAAAHIFPERAAAYVERAYELRDRTIAHLWLPERQYFALGTDYAPGDGTIRLIKTGTANPATLLDTGFFDSLESAERQQYLTGIIEHITTRDFLTSAGIRSRSLSMAHLVSFWDYHGSYVTWPKETNDIARGLRRQGFGKLCRQLENRLLNLVLKTREYPEFVYVDGWGRILAGIPRLHLQHSPVVVVEGTNKPERLQAWTASALMAIVSSRGRAKLKAATYPQTGPWQNDLENDIMTHIPRVNFHLNPLKLWLQYPTYKYHLTDRQEMPAT